MSPLEIYREGERVARYDNEDKLPRNRWSGILGVSSATVMFAIHRGGAGIENAEPPHPNMPSRKVTPVYDFPNIIRGFQKTERSLDGRHYHPWSLSINTEVDEFEIASPSGLTLVFKREE